ncbi:MAG: 2-C-methyl-D-erythritol 4-phosphate cytidylyltransferase [Porcipelethomonas sp.]
MNISMILSGGVGSRFGSDVPKQYNFLCKKEILSYSVEALKDSAENMGIIVLCDNSYSERLSKQYDVICTECGNSRNSSLKNGLDYIKNNYPECDKVFITEAARPFLTSSIVDDYFGLLDEYDAVITAQHITDSLGRKNESVTLRDEYYLIQAPEAFRFEILYSSFSADSNITATVQQLPESRKVKEYYDFKNNMKITYPEDIIIAEQLMKFRNGEI